MVRAMLSVSLEAIIAQALLKRKGGGRVAAHEILLGNPAMRNLIRKGQVPQMYSTMQMSRKIGMCTMKDAVMELVANGIVAEDEAHGFLETSVADGEETKGATKETPEDSRFKRDNKVF
jgi:twitching motility protein PilT